MVMGVWVGGVAEPIDRGLRHPQQIDKLFNEAVVIDEPISWPCHCEVEAWLLAHPEGPLPVPFAFTLKVNGEATS